MIPSSRELAQIESESSAEASPFVSSWRKESRLTQSEREAEPCAKMVSDLCAESQPVSEPVVDARTANRIEVRAIAIGSESHAEAQLRVSVEFGEEMEGPGSFGHRSHAQVVGAGAEGG